MLVPGGEEAEDLDGAPPQSEGPRLRDYVRRASRPVGGGLLRTPLPPHAPPAEARAVRSQLWLLNELQRCGFRIYEALRHPHWPAVRAGLLQGQREVGEEARQLDHVRDRVRRAAPHLHTLSHAPHRICAAPHLLAVLTHRTATRCTTPPPRRTTPRRTTPRRTAPPRTAPHQHAHARPDCAEYCGEIRRVLRRNRRVLRRNSQSSATKSQSSAAKFAEFCGETRRGLHPGNPVNQDRVICRPVAVRGPGVAGAGRPTGQVPSGARGTPPTTLVCARGMPGKVETAFDPQNEPSWGARFLLFLRRLVGINRTAARGGGGRLVRGRGRPGGGR